MDTFRRSVARGPDNAPHKVKLVANTGRVTFDSDAPVEVIENCYAVRLGVSTAEGRVGLLATVAGHAITVNDQGQTLGRWTGAGGYGWAAIKDDLVYVQSPQLADGTAIVRVFTVRAMPTGMEYVVPYSSMGIFRIASNGQPVMAFNQTQTIDGVLFVNSISDGDVTVGQVEALRRGGIGVKVCNNALLMVARTAGFDGYTNLFPEVLDLGPGRKPWIALQGSDKWSETPEPDECDLAPYRSLPDVELLEAPRPVHLVPGDLVWGVDIEGDHWAFELYEQGRPASILFHDTRAPLDAPIATVNGETVTTLWLADKTGAAILYYHDRNVDPDNDAEMSAWLAALEAADTQDNDGRRAFYMGVNAYPRLQPNGDTYGALDVVYCVERMLEACRRAALEVFVFTAGWGGNPVGNPPHLAYPEGDLARTLIELLPVLNGFANVVGVVRFGEGRNDVSTWCEEFFRQWFTAIVKLRLALPVLRRTLPPVVNPPVDTKPPADLPGSVHPGSVPVDGNKGHTTGQQKAVIVAGAGLIGSIVGWIVKKWRGRKKSK